MENEIKIVEFFKDSNSLENIYILAVKNKNEYKNITLTESEIKKLSKYLIKFIDNKDM